MGNRGGGYQMQMMAPFTPVVKVLVIMNVAIWLGLQIILEKYFMSQPFITILFGLQPANFLQNFYVWQPLTYMFLHSYSIFHILFNMLLLWWLGSELEQRWGSKFFLTYYLVSGVGAGVLYCLALVVHAMITGNYTAWATPVVGASGGIFGLLLAYGIIFGERIVYFMMVFPMRAKWFVLILGVVEVSTLLNSGIGGSDVANLAHLGGLASGFLFLQIYTRLQQRRWRNQGGKRSGRGLRLVVNNDKEKKDDKNGPRYWN